MGSPCLHPLDMLKGVLMFPACVVAAVKSFNSSVIQFIMLSPKLKYFSASII